MAKQRYVKQVFWDKKYIRSLGAAGKLLYLYLITGPLANISGSYEITIDRMVWDTGLTEIEVAAWLEKFQADGKVVFQDDWICVLNTIEHQNNATPSVRVGIEEQVKCSPDWVKDRLCIRYGFLSHLNLNSNLNLNSKNGETPVAANAAVELSADEIGPIGIERRIWKDGVDLLTRDGMTEAQARPLLGRLAKQYTELQLATAIAATQAENPADSKAFLIGVLKQHNKNKASMQVGSSDSLPASFGSVTYDPCTKCGSDVCLGGQACDDRSKAKDGN